MTMAPTLSQSSKEGRSSSGMKTASGSHVLQPLPSNSLTLSMSMHSFPSRM